MIDGWSRRNYVVGRIYDLVPESVRGRSPGCARAGVVLTRNSWRGFDELDAASRYCSFRGVHLGSVCLVDDFRLRAVSLQKKQARKMVDRTDSQMTRNSAV